MMRTGPAFVFAALCEIADETCTYTDAIRRRAQQVEEWAARHRDKCDAARQPAKPQLDQPDVCH